MARTKAFKETVQARVQRDPKFRAALLVEGVQSLVAGDVETGKVILRDTINATGGLEKLGEAAKMPPKSLMRMFGRRRTRRQGPTSRGRVQAVTPGSGRRRGH